MNATTVEELKGLYVKMGGSIEDVVDIQTDAEMIEKIKEVAIPAELPSVTSDDNGDVLTVVEGEWAKAEAGGSLPDVTAEDNGDVLTVVEGAWNKAKASNGVKTYHISLSTLSSSYNTPTIEEATTFAEIYAEIEGGANIEFILTADNLKTIVLKGLTKINTTYYFSSMGYDTGQINMAILKIHSTTFGCRQATIAT